MNWMGKNGTFDNSHLVNSYPWGELGSSTIVNVSPCADALRDYDRQCRKQDEQTAPSIAARRISRVVLTWPACTVIYT